MASSPVGKAVVIKSKAPSDNDDEKRWRAESDLRTLGEADKIRSDKSRHSEAKKMAKMKMEEMKKVCE